MFFVWNDVFLSLYFYNIFISTCKLSYIGKPLKADCVVIVAIRPWTDQSHFYRDTVHIRFVYIGTLLPKCTWSSVFVYSKNNKHAEILIPNVITIRNLSRNNSLIIDGLLPHPKRPFWVNRPSLWNKQNLCHWLFVDYVVCVWQHVRKWTGQRWPLGRERQNSTTIFISYIRSKSRVSQVLMRLI